MVMYLNGRFCECQVLVFGLLVACTPPSSMGDATELASSTSTGTVTGGNSSTAPTSGMGSSGGAVSTGQEQPDCEGGEIYRCVLDSFGECSDGSGCVPESLGCSPEACSGTQSVCSELCGPDLECTPMGDIGTVVCTERCDLFQQDCPNGYKCSEWKGATEYRCVPISPGPLPPWDSCDDPLPDDGVDLCDKASTCYGGICHPFCQGDGRDPSCPPGSFCFIEGGAANIRCVKSCDPLVQDCSAGDLCRPVLGGFTCVTDLSGGGGEAQDPCELDNSCAPGLWCAYAELVGGCQASYCCTPFCDHTKLDTCPDEKHECIPWYEEGDSPPGYESLGVCRLP